MDFKSTYDLWLGSGELDEAGRGRLSALSENEIKESFWTDLEFGTAGMRGIIDLGSNRMNIYMVKRATKGLADFVSSLGADAKKRGVVVAYDTRRFSAEFAIAAAKVLAANGINAYIFEDVRPVPMCSFAIRRQGAVAGIMITASHNPKVYNGYKVYGDDGAQMSPESTDEVVKYIAKTPYFGVKEENIVILPEDIKGLDGKKFGEYITVMGKSVDEDYFKAIQALGLSSDAVKKFGKNVKIVYTPIHGTGFMPVTEILKRMDINVTVVPKQALPDPEFSTVRVPNPEEADTLKMGVELADRIGSDVVIGTDPDADRMGVAIRDREGKFVLLNGNQIGVLLAEYIMRRKKEEKVLPKNGAIVKTIVTTEMARKIASSYGVTTFDVLTGFKFIGEKIKEWETTKQFVYLFGFEESYGSLCGTHARDKDAVVATMLFAEMICYYESRGLSVYEVLQQLYAEFGYFSEQSVSITFGGIDGMDRMRNIMLALRKSKYTDVCGTKVLAVSDFADRVQTFADGKSIAIELPKTNALKLHLENGDWICVRPSGTEPKLKIYSAASAKDGVLAKDKSAAYLEAVKKMTE